MLLSNCDLRPDLPEGALPASPASRAADYPQLMDAIALDAALARTGLPEETVEQIQARAGSVDARGAALARREVISAEERAAMAAATAY